jgi:FkbM family methyltransferase
MKSLLVPPAQAAVRLAATNATALAVLNWLYLSFDQRWRERFYWYFAKIFRDRKTKARSSFWKLDFDGTPLRISLRPDQFWLDWDTAVSVLGRDHVTKQSYLNLINSKHRPDIFCDIGSNYGVHTLLVASKGVPTLSFEPNPDCNDRARQIHSDNGFSLQIEQCALGASTGEIKLWFSPVDTWCGTIVQPAAAHNMTEIAVPLRTLDSYIDKLRDKKILIKIDAEGAEKQVLLGAVKVLSECRPLVIFECWPTERQEMFDLFNSFGYDVHSLPWRDVEAESLSLELFQKLDHENFIAVPRHY